MKKVKNAAQAIEFEQIINIGPAAAGDFRNIGLKVPQDLIGKNPVKLYEQICKNTKTFHDPCVLDVVMATVDFMNGGKPQKWWAFTDSRKRDHSAVVDRLREKYS